MMRAGSCGGPAGFALSRFQPHYEEFDPGSGRTLAACLMHASRTGCLRAASGARLSNTFVTYRPVGDNTAKAVLIPHTLHGGKRFGARDEGRAAHQLVGGVMAHQGFDG